MGLKAHLFNILLGKIFIFAVSSLGVMAFSVLVFTSLSTTSFPPPIKEEDLIFFSFNDINVY